MLVPDYIMCRNISDIYNQPQKQFWEGMRTDGGAGKNEPASGGEF